MRSGLATQKPVEALLLLVRRFTLPGEVVFDPFAESGSSCLATRLSGRKYVGIEKDAAYIQVATERLRKGKTSRISAARLVVEVA